jgi:hypothetical protein
MVLLFGASPQVRLLPEVVLEFDSSPVIVIDIRSIKTLPLNRVRRGKPTVIVPRELRPIIYLFFNSL